MEEYVLLDFWASWCNPCKVMNPIIDKIEKDYPNIKIVKVNVDEDSDMVNKYGIRTIPTYILEKDGEIIKAAKGAMSEDKLKKELGI